MNFSLLIKYLNFVDGSRMSFFGRETIFVWILVVVIHRLYGIFWLINLQNLNMVFSIKGHMASHKSLHDTMWSVMKLYDTMWPHMTLYDTMWPHMTLYDTMWPHMILYDLTWPYRTSWGFMW